MQTQKPAGVILAGGLSRRMGGASKALRVLGKRSLLEHVIDRLQPQLGSLLINGDIQPGLFDGFDLPVVPDLIPDHRGPLIGVCSALEYLLEMGLGPDLVVCPCDAPFLPTDLVSRLMDAAGDKQKPVVAVSYEGVLQPTFSMWQTHHLPQIQDSVINNGWGGLKWLLLSLPHVILEWPSDEPPPFFNVNTAGDLNTARGWLDCLPA